ncbi:MAG: DNA-formamidopyrimidine glycosylase [Candidatus Omnitrophica bacterium]|nr:DNA-formamidopyrimidine glycosylase [Candidatus Omnitrophota bacterium]
MPELPEVETIRRQLVKEVVGKRIQAVKILVPKLIKEISPALFRKKVIGLKITDIRRRGKYLIFDLDLRNNKPSLYLQAHLKLTGQLLYSPGPEPAIDYHILFLFQDGSRLYYHDLRRFGGFTLRREDPEPLLNLGPEPLSPAFTFKCWKEIISGKNSRIKIFLLDQHRIAGLGNIYATEALFRAGIHPDRRVSTLGPDEIKKLYRVIKLILKEALKAGGTSIQDYLKPDGSYGNFQKSLFVYRRKGEPCLRCGNPVKVQKDGSRSTYFCPSCQK